MEAKHIKYVISQAIYFYTFEFSKDIILMHDIASFNVIRKKNPLSSLSLFRFLRGFLLLLLFISAISTSEAFYGKVYITLDLTFFFYINACDLKLMITLAELFWFLLYIVSRILFVMVFYDKRIWWKTDGIRYAVKWEAKLKVLFRWQEP